MNQYKYDIHVHTSEVSSCGKIPAKEMVGMYKDAGYHGIVITDHYYEGFFENLPGTSWAEKTDQFLEGCNTAFNEGKKLDFHVICGMEIRFTENSNDYLVYGIDENFLKEHKELYKLGLKGFKKLIEGSGIIIVQAHPFRSGIIPAPPKLIDGIEVFNGNPRHNSNNHLALEYAEKNGLIKLSGSDFHQRDDLARGGIIVSEVINSPSQLADIIWNGRIIELIRNYTSTIINKCQI